jgi:hypothetical protein
MPTQVQFRRGNTAQVQAFTGAVGEIAIDTQRKQISLQDGSTSGGIYVARQDFTQAAFNTANSAANGTYATAAFDTANAAFSKANVANTTADASYAWGNTINVFAQGAFSKANIANTTAEAAYAWANSINVFAQSAFNQANIANTTAEAGFAKANIANTTAEAGFAKANVANTTAEAAYAWANSINTFAVGVAGSVYIANTTAEAAFAKANVANTTAEAGFAKANVANTTAEAGFAKANIANTTAEAGFAKANVANTIAQSAYDHANTKFATAGGSISGDVTVTGNVTPGTANVYTLGTAANPWKSIYAGPSSLYIGDIKLSSVGGALQLDNATNFVIANTSIPNSSVISTTANAAFDKANVANTTAEAAYAWANTVNVFTSSAYATANLANTTAEAGFAKANIANTTAEAGFAKANAVLTYAGSGYGLANTTAVIAQAAFDNSNTKFNSSGGTISGAVTISGTNNLTVSGNLIVQGTTFSSNSTTFEVNDPLILLGVGNYYSDSRDIGFAAHYNDGTNAHSGLIRDYATKEYYFFKGYTPEVSANDNVDITHATFATANVNAGKITANVVANTVTLDNGLRTSNTYTTAAAVTQVSVDSFSTSTYRSAKYQAQMTAGTNYHAIELLLIHDGTTANLVQYAEVVTTSSLGTFDASITTGVLSLLFTPASETVTTIKVIRDSINV